MANEIPRYTDFGPDPGGERWGAVNSPAWLQPVPHGRREVEPDDPLQLRPVVRIGLHYVHADGTITASFFHSKGTNFAIGEDPNGCDWHVWLKLLDYNEGDFPPNP